MCSNELTTLQYHQHALSLPHTLVPVADAKKQTPFPTPCTYRTALTHYVNITGIVSKGVLKDIAEFASSAAHKSFLLSLVSKDGKVSR